MSPSAAIADPPFRQACGRQARPSVPAASPTWRRAQTWRSFVIAPCAPRRTARVRLGPLRLRTPRHSRLTASPTSANLARLIRRAADLATWLGDFATNPYE